MRHHRTRNRVKESFSIIETGCSVVAYRGVRDPGEDGVLWRRNTAMLAIPAKMGSVGIACRESQTTWPLPQKEMIMSTTWNLAFITPITTPSGVSRKLVFENEAGERANLLAGLWSKTTVLNKGTLDGVALTAPTALTVALRNTEHGTVLVTQGMRLSLIDPVVTVVSGKLGADGKPLRNLSGGAFALTTYALSSGGDDPALAGGSIALAPDASDEPALS
jgi:hypothetical protein